MRVLVTGANGFLGKNLCAGLKVLEDITLLEYDLPQTLTELETLVRQSDFVFHLAGVNRPDNPQEFYTVNTGLTESLVELLGQDGRAVPLMLASSSQALIDNPYGRSKREAEDAVSGYANRTGAKIYIYRFPGLFGKWCRPDYNSVVATFCHNTAHGLPLRINDPDVVLRLAYIDDVVAELLSALHGRTETENGFAQVRLTYKIRLLKLAALLDGFRKSRSDLILPDMGDDFTRKLYSTYLSYLPEDAFAYPLTVHEDARGSFAEFIRVPNGGQVSVSVVHPGITKGNHWHHSKNEKFLIVAGTGVIRFRRLGSDKTIEYKVDADILKVVDIPTGYVHSLTNTGETDMVAVIWANEWFVPDRPDTYFEEV